MTCISCTSQTAPSPSTTPCGRCTMPLRIIDADQVSFALKTPWSDGTTHLLLSPFELLEKLAALLPPPRPSYMESWPGCEPSQELRARVADDEARARLLREPYYH